jgi:preprotein translocase subunit SecE
MSLVERTQTFTQEVVQESKKITWPSRADLKESTTVVIISVIILAAMLGVVDRILSLFVEQVLKLS